MLDKEIIFESQKLVEEIYVDEKIKTILYHIVYYTRSRSHITFHLLKIIYYMSVSPRKHLHYCMQLKHMLLQGRHFVIPDDKNITPAILRHRLLLSYEAEAEIYSS